MLDLLIGAVGALYRKQVDEDTVEMNISAEDKTDGCSDTRHVSCQGLVVANFNIRQRAEVVHQGNFASGDVRVA